MMSQSPKEDWPYRLSKTRKKLKIAVAFTLVCLVWGSTYLAIKIGVQSIPPFLLGGMRFLVSGAIILAISLLRPNQRKISRSDTVYAGFTGVLMFAGSNGLVNFAEQTVGSGLAALISATIPLWLVAFETLAESEHRLSPKGRLGLVLGFIGVVLLILPDLASHNFHVAIGEVALVVGSICWATGSWITSQHKFQTATVLLSAIQMLVGGIVMIVISIAQGVFQSQVFAGIVIQSWWALAYLIIFGSCIAFTAYVYLLQNVVASRVTTYAYVNPMVALLLGVMILNEPLTFWILTGTTVILTSLWLIRRPGGNTDDWAISGGESKSTPSS